MSCRKWVSIVLFSSPEPKAHGELIAKQSSRRPSVRACVRASVHTFKHYYLHNQQAYSNQFYLKHHWGGGKAALCFGPDRIGTLVSMAMDSSHWVIMEKILLAAFIFDRIFFILQLTRTTIISRTSSNFGLIRPWAAELAALERLKKFP